MHKKIPISLALARTFHPKMLKLARVVFHPHLLLFFFRHTLDIEVLLISKVVLSTVKDFLYLSVLLHSLYSCFLILVLYFLTSSLGAHPLLLEGWIYHLLRSSLNSSSSTRVAAVLRLFQF